MIFCNRLIVISITVFSLSIGHRLHLKLDYCLRVMCVVIALRYCGHKIDIVDLTSDRSPFLTKTY